MEAQEGRRRRRRAEGPGWLATLLGATLLVTVGFGVGIVAGAAWEEPELVIGHLAGRSEEAVRHADAEAPPGAAPTAAPAAPSPEPAAAAPPPAPLGARREAAPAPSPAAVAAPPPPAAAAPAAAPAGAAVPALPPRGGFSVQVGAFAERKGAQSLTDELRRHGFDARWVDDAGAAPRYKVRVGPVASRAEAEALARRLHAERGLPTWVVARDA